MKRIGPIDFPETKEEAVTWWPKITHRAIHSKVLLVAKMRIEGEWSCYCTPVPGQRHEAEIHLWETEGSKVSASIARAAFPEFNDIPYAT